MKDGPRIARDGLPLKQAGSAWFADLGVDTAAFARHRRPFCRACLDRGERRRHLGGALGTTLLERVVDLKWARQAPRSSHSR